MSCGVRYEFSLVKAPKDATVVATECSGLAIGSVRDAEEQGPADMRRTEPDGSRPDKPQGRLRPKG